MMSPATRLATLLPPALHRSPHCAPAKRIPQLQAARNGSCHDHHSCQSWLRQPFGCSVQCSACMCRMHICAPCIYVSHACIYIYMYKYTRNAAVRSASRPSRQLERAKHHQTCEFMKPPSIYTLGGFMKCMLLFNSNGQGLGVAVAVHVRVAKRFSRFLCWLFVADELVLSNWVYRSSAICASEESYCKVFSSTLSFSRSRRQAAMVQARKLDPRKGDRRN